jgi:hypothetical protein
MVSALIDIFNMVLAVTAGLGVVLWACLLWRSQSGRRMFMSDTNREDKGGSRWSFTPPAAFPDNATCRVRRSKLDDSVDCLSAWAWRCSHALQVEDGYLCRHPKNLEFLARMAADRQK